MPCTSHVRARSWGAKHQVWIKLGLKGQVTYVETAEKGEIGKIAVRSLRNKSSRR